ncbi:hypothetical protein J4438_02600 [Candidatus Woesearchaeota archaeon]|nr:hypothetical protein [Candidatus Woesearchaeota archaeon]
MDEDIVNKIKKYTKDKIFFTKKNYKSSLIERNLDENELKEELLNLKYLKYVIPDKREFHDQKELRFKLYFIYSRSRGRCYVIKFNSILKIITVFPLGRKTLNRYRKRLKEAK